MANVPDNDSLTHSGLVESSGESQWKLLSIVDNTQLGSQQRMVGKLYRSSDIYFARSALLIYSVRAGMERLVSLYCSIPSYTPPQFDFINLFSHYIHR